MLNAVGEGIYHEGSRGTSVINQFGSPICNCLSSLSVSQDGHLGCDVGVLKFQDRICHPYQPFTLIERVLNIMSMFVN